MHEVSLLSLATAVPRHVIEQAEVAALRRKFFRKCRALSGHARHLPEFRNRAAAPPSSVRMVLAARDWTDRSKFS